MANATLAPVLLVSMPQMLDPNFSKTVVLLAEYGAHGAFVGMNPGEAAKLKPLRIRVVTVASGETVQTMSNRMLGTDRKVELFRLLNGLPIGANLTVGQRVKIVAE